MKTDKPHSAKHQPRGLLRNIGFWVLATPLIWAVLIPIFLADIVTEIYHRVTFPIYGIKCVERRKYIRIFDRTKLPYLKWHEKLGCAYCGYMNGWLHYASVIAGRTENYFCAIAHLEDRGYLPAEHEKNFTAYGDDEALRRRYTNVGHDSGAEIN